MSRTNDVNIAMQYAKSGVDGVHLMDSHKATIGWVVNTLAAEVERLEAHLKGSMQAGGYEHFVEQLRNAQRQAHNAIYVAQQLEKKVDELEALDELTTNQAKEYLARAEAAEARVKELEAQLNKRIDAYMNEPHCCSGRECGCMGVTRFEQIVGEELGQRMATMREKNARLRAALVRLDNIYRSELDGEDAPKRPAWLIAALNGEEASK